MVTVNYLDNLKMNIPNVSLHIKGDFQKKFFHQRKSSTSPVNYSINMPRVGKSFIFFIIRQVKNSMLRYQVDPIMKNTQ